MSQLRRRTLTSLFAGMPAFSGLLRIGHRPLMADEERNRSKNSSHRDIGDDVVHAEPLETGVKNHANSGRGELLHVVADKRAQEVRSAVAPGEITGQGNAKLNAHHRPHNVRQVVPHPAEADETRLQAEADNEYEQPVKREQAQPPEVVPKALD